MKINILTTGRFHLLDLARELTSQGFDVKLYTYVSSKRCISFGLSKNAVVSYLWFAFIFLLLEKISKRSEWSMRLKNYAIDLYVSKIMRDADICIGLGSIFNISLSKAKSKGQIYILEWGSMHIKDQISMFNRHYPDWALKNDLFEYDKADYISIPSIHVKDTFIKRGINQNKILVNPYGVNLSHFYPMDCNKEYDIIYIGGWRYEKGCDLIVELCENHPEISFLHVGAIVNMEFPSLPNMFHVSPVDQRELVKYYAKAKVFILPSRAEGLAMVLIQAIACGLPLVCSKHTGGNTLKEHIKNSKWIIEIEKLSSDDLYKCIMEALVLVGNNMNHKEEISNEARIFTWQKYGIRYKNFIEKLETGIEQ